MLRHTALFALTATLLAGCSDFPELDAAITPAARMAGYPSLVPIPQILTDAQDVQITEQSVANLQGRVGRLQARAARLRGPVVDSATRARMRKAIARHR
ncbi:hypothetical protein JI58_05695 [Marinosulfonomonas sp. PRT-SC04]|nr:hypothetical protein JI58_05695 [Marinosulfonomonas sp. PRT-SC04]